MFYVNTLWELLVPSEQILEKAVYWRFGLWILYWFLFIFGRLSKSFEERKILSAFRLGWFSLTNFFLESKLKSIAIVFGALGWIGLESSIHFKKLIKTYCLFLLFFFGLIYFQVKDLILLCQLLLRRGFLIFRLLNDYRFV